MRKPLYFAIAISALAISCQSEIKPIDIPSDSIDNVENVDTVEHPDFYASFEGQSTKAGFDKIDGAYKHHWNLGDNIYVYPKGETNPYPLKYVCTNVNGTFSYVEEYKECGQASGTPSKNYAVYTSQPASLRFDVATNKVTFNISSNPASVGQDASGAYGYDNNMIAVSEDNNLEFKNCMGWIKLQFEGTQKVTSISITGNRALCEGELYVTYDGTSDPTVNTESLEQNYSKINISEPYAQLSTSQATVFYVSMAPVTLTSISVRITFADGTVKTLEKAVNITIGRNTVTPMSVIEVRVPITDLSSAETANCYIVNDAAKVYKFKATVKGNSNESVGTPVKADILWTTQMTDDVTPTKNSVIENVRYFDGYVYFNTPATYVNGNTVIAIRDASDNILWSWHIWSPGISDITTNVDDFSAQSTGLKFMKTDLGNIQGGMFPLYYQWGRKDPFVRKGYNVPKPLTTWPSNALSASTATSTVDNAVANPTTFYKEWNSGNDDSLWKDTEKTIYDPCPAGWRVQSQSELVKVLKQNGGFYTTTHSSISDGSTPYNIGLGHLYVNNAGQFQLNPGDYYWTARYYNGCYYSLFFTDSEFRLRSNGTIASPGQIVRCMADKK